VNLSSLIAAVGDDNVKFQNLDECMQGATRTKRDGNRVTFCTDQPFSMDGMQRLGLVLWLDRDAVAAALNSQPTPP